MKKFRLAHIPFILLGILLVPTISASGQFFQQTVNAQDHIIGVTPTLYCLAAGCPTLSPTKSAAIRVENTHDATTTTIPVSPIATISATAPSITTNPCSDSSLSSLTTLQTPAQSKGNFKGKGTRPDRGGRDSGSDGYGGGNNNDRGGFLGDFFKFFLIIIDLLLRMTGTEGSLPCSPTSSNIPPLSGIPSMNTPIPVAINPTSASGAGLSPSMPTQQSANWAGYVINTPVSSNASITTQWTVTKIDCSGGDGHASSWPGMGGWGNNNSSIAQIGTAEVCKSGSATYYGWTESFPNPVIPLDSTTHAVKIGDQFTGTVSFQGNGSFMTTMTDKTQGWSENLPMKINSFTPTTSEIITESSSDYPIVPKFDAISYPGSIYSPDGIKQTPLSAAPKLVKITNNSDSGVLRTDTSPVKGDTFTTTWTHN